MSEVFAQAVAAVMDRHDSLSWNTLSQGERAKEIYAEMRKIDAESVRGWLMIGGERQAA